MARSEITLGFVGSGKVEKRNAYALLNDFIEASGGNAKFILPLTKTFWNEALDIVSQYAVDKGIPVEAIVDDTTSKVRELKAMLGGARRQHQSNAVPNKMAALLDEARKGTLIVLWDDEDDAALDAVRAAHEKGVALLELTRGLDRIELVNEGDGEDAEPESDEVEEVIVGQDENDEDVVEEVAQDEDEDAGQDDAEDETAEELEENEGEEDDPEEDAEIEAEDDVDGDDDDAEEDGEFPEDEEFSLPEEDESDVAVLDMEADIADEVRQVTGMSEFQQRLLAVLERTSEALVAAINAAMADDAGPAPAAAPAPTKAASSKPAAARPAKKVAAPVKKAAPAKKTTAPPAKAVEKPATKRTIPAKKAAAPAKAETNGGMSKAAAQKIIDAYRPRRGRPPAEVTEARKILGLA